jgi:hypothetical protein
MWDGAMWTGLVWPRIGTGENSCEFGNEPSGSKNAGKLSSGLTACGLSSSAEPHGVDWLGILSI